MKTKVCIWESENIINCVFLYSSYLNIGQKLSAKMKIYNKFTRN